MTELRVLNRCAPSGGGVNGDAQAAAGLIFLGLVIAVAWFVVGLVVGLVL